ncbi:TnpV protein [uncultured Bacteroides sp.]|uniref:TnpV protein n=1 Tax=uncultured Bacteroides sp. TaxID=162156 RepID=UPI0026E0A1E1|nr:TnpV protein [uncultured Bacteroides sp.]
MDKLKKHIYDGNNGLHYTLVDDYYIPDLKLPEESRPIGRYGRLHREYLKQEHPARYSSLILTGKLWTYLADLNEQAEKRRDLIIEQMKAAEGVTEELKARNQLEWVGRMNNIRNRAEEIIKSEMIYL